MTKQVYLIRGRDNEDYLQFRERISSIVSKLATAINPEATKFTITEKAPPGFSIIPFSKKKAAVISVYSNQPVVANFIKDADGFSGGYRVAEALPVNYKVTWKAGEPTPGACLLTLFSRNKNIDYPTFIHRWYDIHSSHSIQIHPLWNYVRNVVNEKLYPGSISFDGIVEEQVREERDLLNPFRFWGNPIVILPRMLKELYDTKSFIDYSSMETYLATEYWIKT